MFFLNEQRKAHKIKRQEAIINSRPFQHLLVENPRPGEILYELRLKEGSNILILASFNARDVEHAKSIATTLLNFSIYKISEGDFYLCDGRSLFNL